MVVREDGSKWACISCLKGHRVSGCNHTDRELHLVPKKGRPVTQCQHCRQERKKRSAHVSCDCAAPDKPHHTKEKCIHLREAEERAKNTGFLDELENSTLASVAEAQGCCCGHDGKCTCALLVRKDSSDIDGLPHGKPAVSKPRLETTKSDGTITVFTNGHHKPVHRKNHAAHECGMPYKMPMPRSKTEQDINPARRSVDSLALDTRAAYPFPARRLSKSEQVSPKLLQAELFSNANGLTSDKYSLIDFSDLDHIPTNNSEGAFPPFDTMSSFIESPFVEDEWPSYQSQAITSNNAFGVWPTNETIMAQPALTAASSGTQSEIDEIPILEDIYTNNMPSIQEVDFTSNTIGTPQTNRRSLPPGFFGNIDFTTPDVLDWQPIESNDKPAPFFNDPWQATISSERRNLGISYPSPGRPMARSVGTGSAPSGDIIKQLFPDMDIETTGQRQGSNGMSMENQEETTMTQGWADGSLSVPVDSFGTPLDLEDGYINQDFNAQWSQ